jgi:prefoldin subunit 5
MPRLREWLGSRQRLWQQQQEIKQLRQELAALQAQNDSMRAGMRRCVTCEYRIDFKQRQGQTTPAEDSDNN